MAQIFKTISLEERLKTSRYNQLPNKPQPVNQGKAPVLTQQREVNQGSTTIKNDQLRVNQGTIEIRKDQPKVNQGGITITQPQSTIDTQTIQLKLTPDAREKNSAILKTYNNPTQQALPTIGNFVTNPITSLAIPYANTSFRSAINLADRLKQPVVVGTTTHLAQYFLSDQYTDYITITPFGIFNHTSDIKLNTPVISTNQGGTNPTPIVFAPQHTSNVIPPIPQADSILKQGVVVSNSQFTSIINITTPIADTTLLQGVILDQNKQVSYITPELSAAAGALTRDPNIQTAVPISVQIISHIQGLVTINGITTSVIEPVIPQQLLPIQVPSSIVITTPQNIQPVVPNNIVIVTPIAAVEQGGVNPTPITFVPRIQTPTLQVLGYSSDRALARFLPEVKHGSESPRNRFFGNVNTAPLGVDKIDVKGITLFRDNVPIPNDNKLVDYIQKLKIESGNQVTWRYNPETTGVQTPPTNQSIYPGYTSLQTSEGIILANNNAQVIQDRVEAGQKLLEDEYIKVIEGLPYSPYTQLIQREKDRSEGTNLQPIRPARTTPSITIQPHNTRADNDTIEISIKSLVGNGDARFEAYLTSFNDNVSVGWNDLQYVGRQDILKTFKSSTRSGAIGFKVAAFRDGDMSQIYAKLNRLIKIVGVGKQSGAGTYITGPLCSITVGRWFKNTPCIFNSVKYDIQTAEYSWDIDKKMPHLVDVSLDFVILGDRSGNPLNATTNNYFNYIG